MTFSQTIQCCVEWPGTVLRIEIARCSMVRINVHTNAKCFLLDEPGRDLRQQFAGDPASALRLGDIDPLQLARASVTTRAVPGDESPQLSLLVGQRMQPGRTEPAAVNALLADTANPLLPKGFGLPFLRTNRRHQGDIMIFKRWDRHLHRRFVWLGIPAGSRVKEFTASARSFETIGKPELTSCRHRLPQVCRQANFLP
jgi:hypothetical protein